MKQSCQHVTDHQLQVLLFEQEESLETIEISRHVETCETCQIRLTELVDDASIESEASQLLCGYTQSSSSAELSGYAASCHFPEAERLQSDSGMLAKAQAEFEAEFDKVLLGPPTHPEMLGRIGRYEIERRIGSGGMGVVFKAIDTELNRPVAVKVLAPHLSRNGAARQRFSRESRAAAAVVHEHVVAIHNVEANAEHPYLVMQYVSGESLQSRVDREGPLDVERILRIGIQAALGLSAAHQHGIVHRDIKPANILLEDGVDRLLITDFGLARTVDDASLTHTGVVAGTPSYMSPEQASGDEVDHRTDLFSLGSVLYFVATGHPPFRAERAMGVLHRICHQRHRPVWQVNSAIPNELSAVIDRLLEKRRARRFANAAAVADSLTHILQQAQNRRPNTMTPNTMTPNTMTPNTMTQLRTFAQRHQLATCAVVCTLFATVGLLVWSRFPTFSPNVSRPTVGNRVEANSAENYADPNSDDLFANEPTGSEPARNSMLGVSGNASGLASPNTTRQSTVGPTRAGTAATMFAADRVEFDQALNSVKTSLYRLENQNEIPEADSFRVFEHEVNTLEQSLIMIDPTPK